MAYETLAAIAAEALDDPTIDIGALVGKVDLSAVMAFDADRCPDCAVAYDGMCAEHIDEGIALGAGGR